MKAPFQHKWDCDGQHSRSSAVPALLEFRRQLTWRECQKAPNAFSRPFRNVDSAGAGEDRAKATDHALKNSRYPTSLAAIKVRADGPVGLCRIARPETP